MRDNEQSTAAKLSACQQREFCIDADLVDTSSAPGFLMMVAL